MSVLAQMVELYEKMAEGYKDRQFENIITKMSMLVRIENYIVIIILYLNNSDKN